MRARIALALLLATATVALGGEKEAREAIAAFKKAYASKEETDRTKAVADLGTVQHKLTVDALAGPLAKDPATSVRRAAATALGGQWAPAAAAVLAKALDAETQHDVELAILNALGGTGADAAVPTLANRLVPKRPGAKDPEGEEAPSADTGAALDALGKIGSSIAIEDLLAFLSKDAALRAKRRGSAPPGPLTKKAEAALEAITGESRSGVNEWRRWWNENKDSLKTVPVYRCDETGQTFERPKADTKCPHCPPEHGKCGTFLRTKLDGAKTPAKNGK